ncbi:hypothetical protein LF1_26900 [Rubripirellula obstinata]|uniref:Uncharacterized protein n=1 Tax=Rubripirellula obstinata TaxID=406547 RepID=A0A5B1CIR2_9BACT|nr:hypothetical protein [Rubripirellula obstinata]KAA1260151.1 hypothetical protein LF1_26900 [Rubripirellula obstinata]
MFRFSIRQLMLMTASVAAGFVMSRSASDDQVLDSRLMAFLLGMISLLLAVGLVQQIIWPPVSLNATAGQQTLRRICLSLILLGIVLGVYRTCIPYPASVIAPNQPLENETVNSELALPLWYFSLMLAIMTAPWFSGVAGRSKNHSQVLGKITSTVVFITVLVYCVAMTFSTTYSFSLVNTEVDAVFDQLSQRNAVGTTHFVEYFDRTPKQFRDFVQWQAITWPPALLACFGLIGWGSTVKSRWWLLALVILITPACVNLCRIVGSQAENVFPIQTKAILGNPIPDAMLLGICFLLVVMRLATKRPEIHLAGDQPNALERETYASDHGLIGWALMAIGVLAIIGLRQKYVGFGTLGYYEMLHAGYNPEVIVGPLMLFVGMQWQWRRFRFQEAAQERWPCIGNRQYLLIPLVGFVLLVTAVTSIPFGVAMLHIGL